MNAKKKLSSILTESCNMKEYMKGTSLSNIRELFRIRTNMNELKGNFKGIHKEEGVLCVACGEQEEVNTHVLVCEKYGDLRRDKNLAEGKDLVSYFREVMKRRDEMQDNGQD